MPQPVAPPPPPETEAGANAYDSVLPAPETEAGASAYGSALPEVSEEDQFWLRAWAADSFTRLLRIFS